MCLGLILIATPFYQVIGYVALHLPVRHDRHHGFGAQDPRRSAGDASGRTANWRRPFEEQANLFDDALNNMSHGLACSTRDGQLLVWNHKLARDPRGASDSVFTKGMSLEDAARPAARPRRRRAQRAAADAIRPELQVQARAAGLSCG